MQAPATTLISLAPTIPDLVDLQWQNVLSNIPGSRDEISTKEYSGASKLAMTYIWDLQREMVKRRDVRVRVINLRELIPSRFRFSTAVHDCMHDRTKLFPSHHRDTYSDGFSVRSDGPTPIAFVKLFKKYYHILQTIPTQPRPRRIPYPAIGQIPAVVHHQAQYVPEPVYQHAQYVPQVAPQVIPDVIEEYIHWYVVVPAVFGKYHIVRKVLVKISAIEIFDFTNGFFVD